MKNVISPHLHEFFEFSVIVKIPGMNLLIIGKIIALIQVKNILSIDSIKEIKLSQVKLYFTTIYPFIVN